MLFKRDILQDIAAGKITLAFRRWQRPRVRQGGTLRTAVGVLEIGTVTPVAAGTVTDRDARRAGHASRAELMAALSAGPPGELYRVELAYRGPDPRTALSRRSAMTRSEQAALLERIAKLDFVSRNGPWVARVLRLIAAHPAIRAGDLSSTLGRERMAFKTDVRKLKALGLTESLNVGYRLSPRGRKVLALLEGNRH